MARLPLEGIRVLDLGMWFAGPMGGRLLGDFGAEVIKIESAGHMDPWRGPVVALPDKRAERYPHGVKLDRPYNCAAGFNLQNRSKYGITLNLGTPQGKEIFKKLVKISDVVLENYTPRVMPKLGFDYDSLKAINPGIIMISMPGLGATGPWRDFVAFGSTIDCMSGDAYLTGYIGEGPMMQSGLAYSDPLGGMNGAFAVLSALQYRRKHGVGMHIDLCQVEGVISFGADSILDYTMNGRIRTRIGNRHRSIAPHGTYRCKGGDNWIAISIPTDEAWRKLCQAMGQPTLAEDPRFEDVIARFNNQDELDRVIEAWTLPRDHYDVMHLLQKAGIPAGAVLDAKELSQDPHLKERGIFEKLTHPEAGTHPYVGMCARLSKTPGKLRMPAPCLGEHNQYVYGKLLGMSQEEIERLDKEGVINNVPPTKQQGGMY